MLLMPENKTQPKDVDKTMIWVNRYTISKLPSIIVLIGEGVELFTLFVSLPSPLIFEYFREIPLPCPIMDYV